jgi:RNA-directed DNA polymerase
MILEPPVSVQKLQAALQTKAKEAPGYRFYLLYDKLYRKDVLEYAYRCCKANRGAPGVDSQDFADIEVRSADPRVRAPRGYRRLPAQPNHQTVGS